MNGIIIQCHCIPCSSLQLTKTTKLVLRCFKSSKHAIYIIRDDWLVSKLGNSATLPLVTVLNLNCFDLRNQI